MRVVTIGAAGLAALVGAGLAWVATVRSAPVGVMERIETSIAGRAGGVNRCYHFRAYGPHNGTVKRSNPDVLATSMAYDVSRGGVRLEGPGWTEYWSLSLYQHNTDNFFVLNDKETQDETFSILILSDDAPVPDGFDGQVVRSPTARGVALIRRYIPGPEFVKRALQNQDRLTCGVIEKGPAS